MKPILLFLLALFVSACSRDDSVKLETYNAEAFAFDIGESLWEVNASTRVKGFKQNENDDQFTASLSYEIDLVTPAGETVNSLISRTEDKIKNEKMSDTVLETQFELDSTYSTGTYKLIFKVRDILSEQADTSVAEFKLE